MATPRTVAFYTLGCKLNYSETSAIGRQFEDAGYGVVKFEDPADIYIINTCSVTEFADRKCRQIVRRAMRQSPQAFVVVGQGHQARGGLVRPSDIKAKLPELPA